MSDLTPLFVTPLFDPSISKELTTLPANQIGEKLGIPSEQAIRGGASGFDVCAMKPSRAKAIAYKSTIAPIVQENYSAPGGAEQVLVPNRAEWTKPVKIGNIPGGN